MVLSFALCATFAFAQTNSLTRTYKAVDNSGAEKVVSTPTQEAGYTGSIFTKDDDAIFYCGFKTADVGYTTGVIGQGDQIDGTAATPHAQVAFHSTWRRFPSNDTNAIKATIGTQANYPASWDMWGQSATGGQYYSSIYNFASPSADSGIMVMTMQDASMTAWGGHGTVAAFNAYIKFGPINTTGETLVRVRFYQKYRCNNADKCYIDYSGNGSTWYQYEINVRNVDVATHANIMGWKTVTMPLAVANTPTAYFRIRWNKDAPDGVGYTGWFWYVDDFYVLPALDNSLNLVSNQYFEGFYQLLPQNLQVPVVWVNEFANNGKNTQSSFTGHVWTYANGATSATELVSKNLGDVTPDPMDVRSIVIDPLGWYDSLSDYNGWGYYSSGHRTGDYASLPTSTLGRYHFYTDITSNHIDHIYGDTSTFDTLGYDVNMYTTADGHSYGVWGRDNGVVRLNSYYATDVTQVTSNGVTYTTSYEDGHATEAGYSVMVSYVTGNSVPQDANGNPWRILGMELTASTVTGMQSPGARLVTCLYADLVDDSNTSSVSFRAVDHGASTYTVKASDVISASILSDTTTPFTYETYRSADNPTIKIMFPNQPELMANTAYRAGYQLDEDADFLVAAATNYYYNDEGRATGFYNEPGMESYGHILNVDNYYSILHIAPLDADFHFLPAETYPMIRLLIGPYYYIPKFAIHLECDNADFGGFIDGNYNDLCGTTDSVPMNGSASYLIMPQQGYDIDQVWVDGVPTTDYEINLDADSVAYGVLTLENVNASHTLRCSFKPHVGFDPVANVSMRLQPNPASSNVRVVMKGVTGNVNMSLIDMSGRVVTTSQFNAENGTTINVSNLAKGAYFVRITNDKFSKIEKLIVR